MTNPEEFYTEKDLPPASLTRSMWKNISSDLFHRQSDYQFRFDKKSFVYGIAASFILYFAGLGIASSIQTFVDRSQPAEVRTDKAYQSAIKEFENVLLSSESGSGRSDTEDLAALRKIRLQYLNTAIDELRREIGPNDVTSVKRQRLTRLYTLKLTLLQDMLQQGEIQL